ncbi:myosin phosphatase Rho interacting protein outspread isoform X2 [Megachile rotundata]|uniref:myosin phosphatase Rho interacting protein outspread isoform X2 n=1 Tax=Megachile rotundata TaxID=143995 RepID=UPI0006151449|nr:PREDICTED: protein outspread isoform X5 [Megachile rotundata]
MSGGTAGVRGTGAECRKFAPNIFNKSKCSSCFKQKEEHSAEALECNRATRKISKCGYLFVAPGWDFSNPLNRTKRWQRRWFVLYDDGELTYSVDEHPETVPQARIDMTRVLEVAAAEDITGHPYSLAITSPEGVTFVKGTCREETRWWADVLQVYSRNKGRHKRNATFPGGQTTILQVTPTIRSNTPNPPRPRFNSCRSEPRSNTWIPESNVSSDLCSSVFSSTPSLVTNSVVTTASSGNMSNGNTEPSNDHRLGNSSPLRTSTPLENGSSYLSSVSSSSPMNGSVSSTVYSTTSTMSTSTMSGSSSLTEKPPIVPNEGRSSYRDQPASSASPPTRDKLRAEDKARRRMNQHGERTSIGTGTACSTEKLDDDPCRRILLEHEREREGKLRDIAASLTQPRARRIKPRTSEPTRDVVDAANAAYQDKFIRGDPDGCGLDISGIRYSPTSELRVDLPAEDLLNIKKGWLMKQALNKEWNKHWFVLRGCGLMYYRDPCAEDKGIMDGVIDLNTVTAVTPLQVARNYGFQTVAWDDRGSTVLSAVTAGIRDSWMTAIRRAANLPDPDSNADLTVCQDSQQDNTPQSPTASITDRERDSVVPSTSVTPRSVLFSSDEEYRTASEGGRRESGDWSEVPVSPPLVRNGDWPSGLKSSSWSDSANHEWSELPPSPPLTRTALSRVKARSRSSSRSRVYKRSRSSPPSSRRSTLDSVRSEDLMMACCELGEDEEQPNGHLQSNSCLSSANESPLIVELLENQVSLLRDQLDHNEAHPSTLLVIIERQENEIESLKSQLNTARADVASAEKELSRLRQQKAEASIREKQVEELLGTIQRTEQQRSKDMDDLEKMKKIYNRDKEMLECKLLETEAILRETSERCEMLSKELASSHRTVEHLQAEIASLSNRLSQGIEENDRLYSKVRELEEKGGLSASRERGRSFDSLSDLTNIELDLDLNALDKERIMEEYDELRSRFEKAIQEIRAMRKELREAHAMQDALELEIFAHKQDAASVSETNQAQIQLMAARIQDLTNKLAASEKQVRTLKQKLTKAESRDKRRSLSLKGRESFQISQEMEDKLLDLENKICAIERGKSIGTPVSTGSSSKESSPNPKKEKRRDSKNLDRTRLRRKSLDSATSSEPMKVLIRLSTLETKVANVTENMASDAEKDSSECSEVSGSSTSEVSLEIIARLRKLERVVSKSKRRLEKCLGSTQAEDKAEKCLREVNDILDSCLECKKNQASAQATESVGVVVSRLETILKDKFTELTKRRQTLAQNGELDDREKMKLIAERVAFEFIVLRQIKRAIGRTYDRSAVLSELVETSQLASSLMRKIHGTKPKTYQNTSYIQYLTKVLANKLVLVGGVNATETSKEVSAARSESLNFLLQKQREVNETVRRYKETKLRQLAEALAVETLSMSDKEDLGKQQASNSSKKLLEDRRIREAWALAQETVSKELVQAEVSHVIMRCGQMYEQNVTSITDVCLNFDGAENITLESWIDATQARLRQEIELSTRELSDAYEECLRLLKRNKSTVETKYESRQLLTDYADVIAHKALIDARIGLLQENTKQLTSYPGETFVSSLIRNDDLLSCLFADDHDFQSNPILDAEYSYLYQQFSKECEERISGKRGSKEQLKNVGQSLLSLEEDLMELSKRVREKSCENADGIVWPKSPAVSDWSNVCEKCSQLREQIKKLSEYMNRITCKQCEQLQETIQRITAEHNEELETLKRNQERDLMDIKGELDNQRQSLTSQYEQEAASLREKARKLEYRLNAMDSEHSAHVNELRAAYQRSMSAELDTDAETRKRYKEEIKQLRALCEKGLLAMENSHRRIISEMEEKHRQELENLRVEKEQALSEETQATLAALDAMRKAHEHEVQKEIAKFKQEFIKQMQAREDIGVLHKEHEEEMEEIKQEILSLSAKYSSKCVESAALEEKVGSLTKQLAQAQQHIMQLDARNKQLRAHLVLDTNDGAINDTVQMLRGKENDIAEPREDLYKLQQLKHGDGPRDTSGVPSKSTGYSPPYSPHRVRSSHEPLARASSEEQRLTGERPKSSLSTLQKSTPDKPAAFSYKLERIKSVSLPYSSNLVRPGGNSGGVQSHDRKETASLGQKGQERNGLASPLWDSLRPRSGLPHQYQELMRSPAVRWSSRSCRSLPPTPTPNYHHPLHPPLPAVGMVAERKKRFEL